MKQSDRAGGTSGDVPPQSGTPGMRKKFNFINMDVGGIYASLYIYPPPLLDKLALAPFGRGVL